MGKQIFIMQLLLQWLHLNQFSAAYQPRMGTVAHCYIGIYFGMWHYHIYNFFINFTTFKNRFEIVMSGAHLISILCNSHYSQN